MTVQEWKEYYTRMVHRGGMKPEKRREMVEKCGGLLSHLEEIDGVEVTITETQGEAEDRLLTEIGRMYET